MEILSLKRPNDGALMLTRLFASLRGFLYAACFVWIWWRVVVYARAWDARIAFSIPEWLRVPGMILVILGSIIALSCVATFAFVGKGTPAPFDAPREFVAVGPYQYVRNPMYIGALAVIIGAGLMIRSPSALGVGLFFVFLAHLFVLIYEEPTLEQKFGASYTQYKATVNRWLPRIPK
jgi:protein-S-isoprenylcysteine O-methyltransferase Ste14